MCFKILFEEIEEIMSFVCVCVCVFGERECVFEKRIKSSFLETMIVAIFEWIYDVCFEVVFFERGEWGDL